MAESYWEQAARGAKPNAGTTFLTNPTAYTGMTPGGFDWNNVLVSGNGVGGGSQNGPAWDASQASNLQRAATMRQKSLQDRLFAEAGQQQAAQKAATQSRLDEVKAGYKERRATAAASFKGAGQLGVDEINRHFDQLVGRTRSQMTASGLGQTTIPGTTIAGIERDRAAALRDAASRNGIEASGVDMQASGDYLNFLTNINDNFDAGPLAELARANGQATQNQLDPSAFGGNFFPNPGAGVLGGSAYGFDAYDGGGGGGGYNAGYAGNGLSPEETAMYFGGQQQQPQRPAAVKPTGRNVSVAQQDMDQRRFFANQQLQQQAQLRRKQAPANQFGLEAAMWGY